MTLHKIYSLNTPTLKGDLSYHLPYMQTAQTYSATSIEDLTAVTHRIHTLYPKAAIVGVGISLGGYAIILCYALIHVV